MLLRPQQRDGARDPLPSYESMRRQARAFLEESREMIRAHVDHGSQLGDPERSVEVLLDIVAHSSNPAPGKAGRLLRDLPCPDDPLSIHDFLPRVTGAGRAWC